MTIGIIGLGLMGGSLGMDLRHLPFVKEVIGHDHNPQHCKTALEMRLVDAVVDFDRLVRSDVIFLSVPVDAIISILTELPGKIGPGTTVIDLGSTKARIAESIPAAIRRNVVTAHPMTGTEHFGPTAALSGLYKDKVVVLCDMEESGQQQQENAVRLFSGLHMRLHYMRAEEHDRHAAFISHMPHAISYSLANTVLGQEDKYNILALAAGGFRSMSRLAKSSPVMWEDIFRQNKEHLLEAIHLFEDELSAMKKAIKNDEWEEVNKRLATGQKLYEIIT
jgi:prephenate dehydrogenase